MKRTVASWEVDPAVKKCGLFYKHSVRDIPAGKVLQPDVTRWL